MYPSPTTPYTERQKKNILNRVNLYMFTTFTHPFSAANYITSTPFKNTLNTILKNTIRTQDEIKLQKLIAMHPHRQDLKLQLLELQRKQKSSTKPNKLKKTKRKKK